MNFLALDVDECLTPSTNPCNQICTNTDGDFECSCMSGFQLESKFTCVGEYYMYMYIYNYNTLFIHVLFT